jgi:hypothetical protein
MKNMIARRFRCRLLFQDHRTLTLMPVSMSEGSQAARPPLRKLASISICQDPVLATP